MTHIKLLFDVLDWIHPFKRPSLTPDQVSWLLFSNRMSRISRTECGEWNDLWLKPAKPSLKGPLTASFLPAACLLCTKQVRMTHPWWDRLISWSVIFTVGPAFSQIFFRFSLWLSSLLYSLECHDNWLKQKFMCTPLVAACGLTCVSATFLWAEMK